MITQRETLSSLRSKFAAVALPGDELYEQGRGSWNLAIDARPAAIVKPRTTEEVAEAVHFARNQKLLIAVRSGGHAASGFGGSDGSLLIALGGLRELEIAPEARQAWAGAGLIAGEYTTAAHAHGLATTFGDTASVGLGGLITGGGMGWMVRKHGLTIDHLLAAEIVTAKGEILVASEAQYPDLFWAIRGGGGNFGIVTRFLLRLTPVGMVYGGGLFLPADPVTIRRFLDYSLEAPDSLTTIGQLMPLPRLPFLPAELHGRQVFSVAAVNVGDLDEGERVMAPLRHLAKPIADLLGPMPYPRIYDLTAEASTRNYFSLRSGFMQEVGDDVIETLVDGHRRSPSFLPMVQFRALGGQMARVDTAATAFAHRDARFMVTVMSDGMDPQAAAAEHRWVTELWDLIDDDVTGVYVNFLAEDGRQRLGDAYPPKTLARLADIKRRYDPDNAFRVNQNIRPA